MRIVNHANVYNSCLRLLRDRGWDVQARVPTYEDDDELWPDGFSAARAGVNIVAANPLELLGLSQLADASEPTNEPYWWVVEGPDEMGRIADEALRASFWTFYQRAPWAWTEVVRSELSETSDQSERIEPHERLGVPPEDMEKIRTLLQPSSSVSSKPRGPIVVQFQPERINWELSVSEVSSTLARAVDGLPSVQVLKPTEAAEDDDYSNFTIKSASPSSVWSALRSGLDAAPRLAEAVIVVCAWDPTWQDYLLLHHFDPDERVDTFEV